MPPHKSEDYKITAVQYYLSKNNNQVYPDLQSFKHLDFLLNLLEPVLQFNLQRVVVGFFLFPLGHLLRVCVTFFVDLGFNKPSSIGSIVFISMKYTIFED